MRRLLLVLALLLALVPSSALAFEPRAGNDVTVGPGEVINDDLYAAGGNVNIQGTVRGDVIAAGGSITVTGQVERNVRAFGGSLLVDGPVGGDVIYSGGNLSVGPNARIARDLVVGSGSATVNGEVGRNVFSGSGDLSLNGRVGGDVQAGGATVRLGSGAVVTGNLNYTSDREAIIAPGAQVQGTVQRQIPETQRNTTLDATVGWLRNLVGLLALGLIFALVFPRFARRTTDTIDRSPWASLGLGVLVLIVVPIVAALLFGLGFLVGGWWLGLITLGIYGLALALSVPVSGNYLGQWILDRAGRRDIQPVWGLVLGLVILLLVALVPYVGGLVLFVALLFGLGALALAAVRSRREPPPALIERGPAPTGEPPEGRIAA